MLIGLALLLTCTAGVPTKRAVAQNWKEPSAADQTITRDDISHSGATRIDEVLRLIPGWFSYSIDGFTWGTVPDVLDLPRQESWTLLIDGQSVDVRVLGNLEINALGLDVGLIDSVEVFSSPTIHRGVFAPYGLVHIHTRRSKRFYEVQGSLGVGNMTGDPGPFLFTPHDSPNIDRIGPIASGSAAAAGHLWYARGAMRFDEHHITDPRIWPRVWLLYQEHFQARQQLLAQRFDARGFILSGETSVSIDNFRLHQFRFVEEIGAEVPVTLVYLRFGLAGDLEVSRGVRVFYTGHYTVTELDPRPNSADLQFDYRENRGFGAAGLRLDLPEVNVEVGASREVRNVHSDDPIAGPQVSSTGAYASLSSQVLPTLAWSAAFDVREAESELLVSALAGLYYRRSIGRVAMHGRIRGAQIRSPRWTGGDLWFWTQRGFGFLGRAGANGTVSESASIPERLWGEAAAGAAWGKIGSLTVSGAYSRFSQRTIPVYRRLLEYRDVGLFQREATMFATHFELETPVAGEALRGSVDALFKPLPSLTHRANYSYTIPFSRHASFRDLWASVPDHQLYTSITYAPKSRVSLFLRLRYTSWSDWPEYADVERESGQFYPARLPTHLSLDFAVNKHFWTDRLSASVLLTNLLNRYVQRHPAARVESIAMHARVEVRI